MNVQATANDPTSLLTEADEDYLALVRRCPLRPIRCEAELDRAIATLHWLIDKAVAGLRTESEEDYMDVLGDLVERFETEHYPERVIPAPEMLAHLLDMRGSTVAELAAGSGLPESALSAILDGDRPASHEELHAIAGFLGIEPTVFWELERPAATVAE